MDTNNLRYFAAVAKYGSITQAAKAAYISQPQLSHIIRQLEKEMGLTLFRRTSHGTKLTVDGQRILLHCQVILKEMDRLQNMVNAHRIEKSCLNVSMTRFSHTAECYNEICRRYQDIDSFTGRLCEGATLDVVQDVKENRSNIGILHMAGKEADDLARNFEEQGLIYEPLATFRPYVCLSSEHELIRTVGRHGIDIRELVDYGFVRYIGQYEDFIYHLTTESGPIDLNNARKIIYVNDRQEQMRLLSRTNFFTVGIMEFRDQDSSTVSSPYRSLAARNGSALAPFEKRDQTFPDGAGFPRPCVHPLQKNGDGGHRLTLKKDWKRRIFLLFQSFLQFRSEADQLGITDTVKVPYNLKGSPIDRAVDGEYHHGSPFFFLRLTCMVAMLTCPAPKRVPI